MCLSKYSTTTDLVSPSSYRYISSGSNDVTATYSRTSNLNPTKQKPVNNYNYIEKPIS